VSDRRVRVGRDAVAVLLAVLAVGWLAAGPAAAAAGLTGRAARQLAALQEIKASLSPAERKLDSRIVVALRERRGAVAAQALPELRTGVKAAGLTAVDVRLRAASGAVLQRLRAAGAQVRAVSRRLASVRASMPLAALARVAAWPDVRRIDLAAGAITARMARPLATGTKAARARRLERRLRAVLAPSQGTVVSEGDRAHNADRARAATGVNGVGVKVCALSDGVSSLAAVQAAGELPAVDVLPGEAGDGDEGTAMLEIVHDLAPKAELGFATAFTSDASFADNIRALRSQAGCDVIVDDVLYFNESPFQDGPIAQAVNAVTADGALYFSSAGNEGNVLDGTSGNYEGVFRPSGQAVGKFRGDAHDFDPGAGVQRFEPLSDASAQVPVTLWWADALGQAADDYDLYEFDAQGNVLAVSQNVQDGDDDPFEILGTAGAPGMRLAVVKFAGADRYFQLSALRGRFTDSADGLVARVTPGVLRGHTAAVDAFSTAAAPAAQPLPFDLEPGDPANPAGPFPGSFTSAQAPERFTSDGPRRVFFAPDGTPLTPGDLTASGGVVRRKPDITAADGVRVTAPDFNPFFGTSAAAPHAAAIAALVRSGNPGAGLAEVRSAFAATALDLAPAGWDPRTGRGIVMADRTLAETGATPQPLVEARAPTVTAIEGDGDRFLEPGERATLRVPARNVGDGTATGVSVRLAPTDPRVSVIPRAQGYGTIAPDIAISRSFRVALAADYPLGKPLALAVRVTFAGVLSPTSRTLTVPTGQPAAEVTAFRYDGPAVPIPDADERGAAVTLGVPADFGYASQLTFSIDGERCTAEEGATTVGLDHTFVGDLVGTLRAPTGREAILFERAGGGGNNLCRVVFDDAAERPLALAAAEEAPFTGAWRPRDPLSALLADPVGGEWTFRVQDLAGADVGSIRAVSLRLRGFQAP
jgi:subtilisin-like proprotein convertase family protein